MSQRAGQDVDDLDRDISDLSDLSDLSDNLPSDDAQSMIQSSVKRADTRSHALFREG